MSMGKLTDDRGKNTEAKEKNLRKKEKIKKLDDCIRGDIVRLAFGGLWIAITDSSFRTTDAKIAARKTRVLCRALNEDGSWSEPEHLPVAMLISEVGELK